MTTIKRTVRYSGAVPRDRTVAGTKTAVSINITLDLESDGSPVGASHGRVEFRSASYSLAEWHRIVGHVEEILRGVGV